MTSKKLVKNLQNYLAPLVDIPVYCHDSNAPRELPCVVVGYEREEITMRGIPGHFTVSGFVLVMFNGYEDEDNSDGDDVSADVIYALTDRDALAASLNKPVSGMDSRPEADFTLNQLSVRGTDRAIEDNSTAITVNFDAFTVACDVF